jgi:SAM-dependent methyltransferase
MAEANETVQVIDGVRCYAPELAMENNDFPLDQFEALYKGEETNFWFRSRNRIIMHQFHKRNMGDKSGRLLEIGCGTGYVLNGLSKEFPKLKLAGAEIYLSGLHFARKRLPAVEFVQLDATRMPFENEYEAIGAFDVLEHIDADTEVMRNVYKALRPGGFFFITVPQHPALWSAIDEFSCHKRRYTRAEMKGKLQEVGFEVKRVTSFVSSLLPILYLSRIRRKNVKAADLTHEQILSELYLNPVLNTVFGWMMRIDEFFIRLGISLPAGGSLLVVAQKKIN